MRVEVRNLRINNRIWNKASYEMEFRGLFESLTLIDSRTRSITLTLNNTVNPADQVSLSRHCVWRIWLYLIISQDRNDSGLKNEILTLLSFFRCLDSYEILSLIHSILIVFWHVISIISYQSFIIFNSTWPINYIVFFIRSTASDSALNFNQIDLHYIRYIRVKLLYCSLTSRSYLSAVNPAFNQSITFHIEQSVD